MYDVVTRNVSLGALATLGIGGPADLYLKVGDISTMQEVLKWCAAERLAYFILGKGSNCLFDSRGFRGVVIHNKIDFYIEEGEGQVYAGAGYSFAHLGIRTAQRGWSGLEFAAGIPASVGGAVFMNAGSQRDETWGPLTYVDFVDEQGALQRFTKEELRSGYRYSSFQAMQGAIVAAGFSLTPHHEARQVQKALLEARMRSQPYGSKSAGCAFRNPDHCPAGRLIDEAGLKGLSVGGAQISRQHANFLINAGGATSEEVRALIASVQERIFVQTGIRLELEIRYIASGEGVHAH
jgi:UDP-N-acetylmuramate dehydrogenase